MAETPLVAVIRGDGIGGDVTDATLAIAGRLCPAAGRRPCDMMTFMRAPPITPRPAGT